MGRRKVAPQRFTGQHATLGNGTSQLEQCHEKPVPAPGPPPQEPESEPGDAPPPRKRQRLQQADDGPQLLPLLGGVPNATSRPLATVMLLPPAQVSTEVAARTLCVSLDGKPRASCVCGSLWLCDEHGVGLCSAGTIEVGSGPSPS